MEQGQRQHHEGIRLLRIEVDFDRNMSLYWRGAMINESQGSQRISWKRTMPRTYNVHYRIKYKGARFHPDSLSIVVDALCVTVPVPGKFPNAARDSSEGAAARLWRVHFLTKNRSGEPIFRDLQLCAQLVSSETTLSHCFALLPIS